MNKILQVKEIFISYGTVEIIKELSLDLYSGSIIGLLGSNGAGKTTLLLSLSGQFKPQRGEICFENSDIYEKNIEYKTSIGYVDENPFFYSYLTAEEFLYFVAKIKKIPTDELDSQVSQVLDLVCLNNEKQKKACDLSQGMRKKLAVASALLGSPKILFFDEAFNGVDIESTFKIRKTLENLAFKDTTIILSSHALQVIEKICDRYLVLKNGNLVADFNVVDKRDAYQDFNLEQYVIDLLK